MENNALLLLRSGGKSTEKIYSSKSTITFQKYSVRRVKTTCPKIYLSESKRVASLKVLMSIE